MIEPKTIIEANPMALAVNADIVPLMTSAGRRTSHMGSGDLRPMIYRDGALDAYELPSRIGSHLHYPVQHLPSDDTEGGEA